MPAVANGSHAVQGNIQDIELEKETAEVKPKNLGGIP